MTELKIVLDRSLSMESIKGNMEEGLNTYISEQAKLPGELLISLYQFDHEYKKVFEKRPAKNVAPIRIHPRGSTALWDAIGRTIAPINFVKSVREEQIGYVNTYGQVHSYKAGNGDVPVYKKIQVGNDIIVVIITDGEENSSREYNAWSLKNLVSSKQELGVNFVFLGANQDAVLTAATIGIPLANSITYRPTYAGVYNLTQSLGSYTNSLRSTGSATFDSNDRENAMAS